jgi:hypothetical protein
MGNTSQILHVLRHVLAKNMDSSTFVAELRVQSVSYIGRNSGQPVSDSDINNGRDTVGGLRLTMRSGDEYDLTLSEVVEDNQKHDHTA